MYSSPFNQMDNSRVYFSQHNIQAALPEDGKDNPIFLPGCLLIRCEKENDEPFLEWWPLEDASSPTSPENISLEELESVGYNPRKSSDAIEIHRFPSHHIKTELAELRSYRLQEEPPGSRIVFYLQDGSSLHPLYFPEHNPRPFLVALENFYHFKRSATEKDLYVVQYPTQKVLEKSFSELNILDSAHIQNFISDPVTSTLSGLAKVSTFFFDPHTYYAARASYDGTRRATTHKLQPHPQTVTILNQEQDESSFEVITCMEVPPRVPTAREDPLSEAQWTAHKTPEGKIQNFDQLRRIIFKGGIEPTLRREVWKYLLGYFNPELTAKEQEEVRKEKEDYYFTMKLQWKTISEDQQSRFYHYRERKSMVDKDVGRTDRTHPYFQGENNAHLETLREILMTYCMYNFDLGYVQGMSDLLSPILLVMDNETDAFWCFVKLMDRIGLNFEMSQRTIMLQLENLRILLGALENEFVDYLEGREASNLYFCFRWILIWFKREFKIPDVLKLWEVLLTDLPCKNFHLLVCMGILSLHKNYIMENKFGFTEILKYINDLSMTLNLDEILCEAESIYNQLCQCTELPDIVRDILGFPPLPSSPKEACNGMRQSLSPSPDDPIDLEKI